MDDSQLDKILFLQRLIRSFYVRRQFESVRNEYLKTLSDIEGETLVTPVVTEQPPPPPQPIQTIAVKSPPNRNELLRKREELAIELLWLEQAIQSRKDYLRLKARYTTSVS